MDKAEMSLRVCLPSSLVEVGLFAYNVWAKLKLSFSKTDDGADPVLGIGGMTQIEGIVSSHPSPEASIPFIMMHPP